MIKGVRIDNLKRFYFELDDDKPIQILLNKHEDGEEGWFDMHYEFELGVVLEGKMKRSYLECDMELGPGEVWFCNMWEPHGFEVLEAPCEVVVFVVDPGYLATTPLFDRDMVPTFMYPPMDRPRAAANLMDEIKGLARKVKQRFSKKYDADWAKLYLFQLLLSLMEDWKVPPQGLSYGSRASIQGALRLVFEEKRLISTKEAALACQMSVTKFTALFKDLMGSTFSDFALQYRVKGASFQLKNSNLTQETVALNWGFSDASHLHKYLHNP
ncbi:MAG: helix-turn-helix domain-containing protein [Flavobacteriaceae bacterium]|nr:helix-turn-helix domain-containing protein [Flavobacteriaceae bacterium]